MIIYLALLALVGVVVRQFTVLLVEGGGILFGLIVLAAMFWIGRHLSVKYDL